MLTTLKTVVGSVVGVMVALICWPAAGGVISVSATAPAVDGADIANLANPGPGAGAFDPGGDEGHVWSDRPLQGQTFTTLGNAFGYRLNSVTLQDEENDINNNSSPFMVRIGTISGSTFTPVAIESSTNTISYATNDFITFNFFNPVNLAPNTVYGFDWDASASGFTTWNNADTNYAGGTGYSSGASGNPDDLNLVFRDIDRVFHVDLEANTEAPPPPPTPVPVSNFSFELPGTDKIQNGFGSIPGWNDFVGQTYNDTGVEAAYSPTDGSWRAFFMGSDGGAWQSLGTTIEGGDTFTLTVDAAQNTSTELTFGFFSGADPANVIAQESVPGTGSGVENWDTFSTSFTAPAGAPYLGQPLGIFVDNTAGSWMGLDNVRLDLLAAEPPSGSEGSIGINFTGRIADSTAPDLLQVEAGASAGNPAGVLGVTTPWNDVLTNNINSGTVDVTGTDGETATVQWSVTGTWSMTANGSRIVPDEDPDGDMKDGHIEGTDPNGINVVVSGLDEFDAYDVYLYVGDDAGGRQGQFSINGEPPLSFTSKLFDGTYTEGVDYLLFSGITGDSFTITGGGLDVPNRTGIHGIEIVGIGGAQVVPEPSTFALAALGLLGLGALGWRRRK